MTDSEVNKIIIEFLGYEFVEVYNCEILGTDMVVFIKDGEQYNDNAFTDSLDTLVPIWKKMDSCMKSFVNNDFRLTGPSYSWTVSDNHNSEEDKTLQQAAAHATAKAILELNK
jgi:hypothetical protein